jgi:hypothetical protein
MRHRQPRLMDEWGCEFFGEAKTSVGDVWWYDDPQDDGTIKRRPLLPMRAKTEEDGAGLWVRTTTPNAAR